MMYKSGMVLGSALTMNLAINLALLPLSPVPPSHAYADTSSWVRGTKVKPQAKKTRHAKTATKPARKLSPGDAAYAAFENGRYLTALKLAKQAAANGTAHAWTLIGRIYGEGLGVPRDLKQAAQAYEQGAKRGDVNAQAAIGVMLAKGEGIAKDTKKARHYLKQAAAKGHQDAQYNLGLLIMQGKDGVSPDIEAGAIWLARAAARGHLAAKYDLGTLYAMGKGVPQDFKKAAYWIGQAAEANMPAAMLDYAVMLFKGRGVKKDKKRAFEFFREAALKNNPVAQNRLARLYAFGVVDGEQLIVERDYVKAAKWHLIARSQGVADARLDLFLASLKKAERAKADQEAEIWLAQVR